MTQQCLMHEKLCKESYIHMLRAEVSLQLALSLKNLSALGGGLVTLFFFEPH